MEATDLLFALLRTVICGEKANEELKIACTPENLEAAYALAKKHDLAHLVGLAASTLGLPDNETVSKCKQVALQALYRYMRLNHGYLQICQALEKAKIPFIPLKGSVLREYYPESWMRTSCDIDILVKERELDTAVAVLTESLGYTALPRGDHDISLLSPEGVHLELHYDTIQERYEAGDCRDVLAQIWEDATPVKAGSFQMVLSDAMFYFYHMAHMAKHVENGGCGIRAFLDIWVLRHRVDHDPAVREALLQEGGLWKFAQGAEQIAAWWFCGEKPSPMTRQFSDYILQAGLYGSNANRAALGQAKTGGKMRYLLHRVFMPYDFLKAEYPVLRKHKWLTPLFQVVRWCRMFFSGGTKKTIKELRANTRVSLDAKTQAEQLLTYLGLE